MQVDKYGQHIYTLDDVFDHIMCKPDDRPVRITATESITFDSTLELQDPPKIRMYHDPLLTVEQYDREQQNNWLMPQKYKDLDIAQWLLNKCTTDAELQRVGQELLLYQEYDMFDLLRYTVYLVDTMRENNIVWGVGRGSSIASYVLYLIGIHRINSMVYDLDIREFLK